MSFAAASKTEEGFYDGSSGHSEKNAQQETAPEDPEISQNGNESVDFGRSSSGSEVDPYVNHTKEKNPSSQRHPGILGFHTRKVGRKRSPSPAYSHNQGVRLSRHGSPTPNTDWSQPGVSGEWAMEHHRENIFRKNPSRSLYIRFSRWLQSNTGASSNGKSASNQNSRSIEKGSILVSLAELQRMRLRKLQIELVKQAIEMRHTGNETNDWEQTLQQYIQTLRDNDYIHSCRTRPSDPFIVISSRIHDAEVLRGVFDALPKDLTKDTLKDFIVAEPLEKGDPQPIGGTRLDTYNDAWWENFLLRIGMATVGGGFLVGPMWLMVLHNTLYTALITTTVCVFLFGVVMALVLGDLMNVLSVTAAYAAVLVVFVGTTTQTTTLP